MLRAPRTRVKAHKAFASRGRAALCMRPVAIQSRQYCVQDMWETHLADQALCHCQPRRLAKSVWPLLPGDCWLGQQLKRLVLRTHLCQETVLTICDVSASECTSILVGATADEALLQLDIFRFNTFEQIFNFQKKRLRAERFEERDFLKRSSLKAQK